MQAQLKVDATPALDSCTISAYEGSEGFHAIRAEWQRLWAISEDATETQTWDWQYLYWKHLAPRTVPVFVTARSHDGECVAIGAFFVCRDAQSGLSKAAFLGDKKPDYHLLLARPGLHPSVGAQILQHFASQQAAAARYVEFSNIPANSYTALSLAELFLNDAKDNVSRWNTETYSVPLPKSLDEYLKMLGPRTRRDFRYDRRKIAEEFSADFRVCRSRDALPEALDAIETVDRARWGTNSRYCIGAQRTFENAVAEALCDLGIYRAYVLYLNGVPRAFVTGAVVRNRLKISSIGFDRSVPGRWSIGKVANFYAIENCIENGIEEYDLTRGGEEYKKWLGGTASTNLHVRRYRSRIDRAIVTNGTRLVVFLRNQDWLRNMYQRWIRK